MIQACTWIIFTVIIAIIAKKMNEKKATMMEIAKTLMLSAVAYFTITGFGPVITASISNMAAKIIGDKAAGYFTFIMVFLAVISIGALVEKFVFNPQKKKFYWFCVAVCGFSAATITHNPNNMIEASDIFIIQLGLILLAATIAWWKDSLQNSLANPIGLVLCIFNTMLFYFMYTGINLFEMQNIKIQNSGMLVIFLISAAMFSTIWDNNEKWNKRWAFWALSIYTVGIMIASGYMGVIYFAASEQEERRVKAEINVLQKSILAAELKKVKVETVVGGITNDDVKVIINKNDATLDEMKMALNQRKAVAQQMENMVYEAPESKPLSNNRKKEEFEKKIFSAPKAAINKIGNFLSFGETNDEDEKKIIFEGNYTFADAFTKDGTIKTIDTTRTPFKIGDEILISASDNTGNFSGKEILVWTEEDQGPRWFKTEGGYFKKAVTENQDYGFFLINTNGRRDVKINVRLRRMG